jgi:hypothetical protein
VRERERERERESLEMKYRQMMVVVFLTIFHDLQKKFAIKVTHFFSVFCSYLLGQVLNQTKNKLIKNASVCVDSSFSILIFSPDLNLT